MLTTCECVWDQHPDWITNHHCCVQRVVSVWQGGSSCGVSFTHPQYILMLCYFIFILHNMAEGNIIHPYSLISKGSCSYFAN